MRIGWKALGVPLVAGAMWLLPSDRPESEVAGAAEAATLSESTAEVSSAPLIVTTSAPPTTALQTTVSATTTTTTATTRSISTTTTTTTTTAVPSTLALVSKEQEALERVSFNWRSAFPDWRIEFHGPRNGLRALTFPEERRIEIFVRSSDTASSLHRVFAHELGHVVDVEFNTDRDRQRWIEQRGLSADTPWWPSAEAPDFATGAGDFAEAFAVWETGVTTRSSVAGQPSAEDLELVRDLSRG